MDSVIEILQQTTSPWLRGLIFFSVVLLFVGGRMYDVRRRKKIEEENIKETRTALKIKKLILEIEMMEGAMQQQVSDTGKGQSLQLFEDNVNKMKSLMRQKTLWPDKMIYGLMGSFFFLLLIVLFNMMTNMNAQHVEQYIYVYFVKDMVISMVVGIGVALIPGTQRWNYFFYGLSLPILLAFLIVSFKT